MESADKNFIVTLLLIIAGFILSETIIRDFIDVLGEEVLRFALGGLAVLLILLAFSIKNKSFVDPLIKFFIVYLLLSAIALYLVLTDVVEAWILAILIYSLVICLIIYVIRLISNRTT
ncbi:MAG: hypothetical protein KJ718_02045 [Nanoarchaeota archaeon]|nr:hypothetical protein [Nanoarchaeota archaeon]MBU1051316.1 hypothetical protein [Nanoarchaeota archaeon]MBU1988456.1 hypothetical protein [Nanoarchaeota archaeon]